MKICMIGSGYVGLVSGACFADLGNSVWCVDKDKEKIDLLNYNQVRLNIMIWVMVLYLKRWKNLLEVIIKLL